MKQYTEKETEHYYDSEDEVYLSFWDEKGTLHWGIFNEDEDHITY